MHGSLGLRPATLADQGRDLSHQLGTHAQVRSFLGRVGNRVPYAGVTGLRHAALSGHASANAVTSRSPRSGLVGSGSSMPAIL